MGVCLIIVIIVIVVVVVTRPVFNISSFIERRGILLRVVKLFSFF